MPNGEQAPLFNGSTEYLDVKNPSFSIPTIGDLTWEIWIQRTVCNFRTATSFDNYVDVMVKCANYSPSCARQMALVLAK